MHLRKLFIYVLLSLLFSQALANEPDRHSGLMFGAFTYGGVWQGMEPVFELEAALGRRLDVVHWFMNFDHDWDPQLVRDASQDGRLPMISWQPHRQSVEDIAAGRYDLYLTTWAAGVAAHEGLVYLRPFPEMNGDWLSWNGSPDELVTAWRRMVNLFEFVGADNVRWVWSPNVTDWPRTEENRMERYYPGSDYVDVLALDGYNFGTNKANIGWRSYEEVFSIGYERITSLGDQPLWMAEIASAEKGGNKAAWIEEMFASTVFPRVTALIWFDEHKGSDWRIRSSGEAVTALRAGLDAQLIVAGD